MLKTIIKRVLQIIPMLFIISIISFALIKLAPGDPVNSFVTPDMNPDDVERIRQSLGLDQPIYVQYFIWLGNLLQGNLGYSIVNSQPVLQQILERIPATLGLVGTSLVLTLLLSIPLGLVAANYENTWIDKILNGISYIGISIPIFWFGYDFNRCIFDSARLASKSRDANDWGRLFLGYGGACDFTSYNADFPRMCGILSLRPLEYNQSIKRRICFIWLCERSIQSANYGASCLEKFLAASYNATWNVTSASHYRRFYYRKYFFHGREWDRLESTRFSN